MFVFVFVFVCLCVYVCMCQCVCVSVCVCVCVRLLLLLLSRFAYVPLRFSSCYFLVVFVVALFMCDVSSPCLCSFLSFVFFSFQSFSMVAALALVPITLCTMAAHGSLQGEMNGGFALQDLFSICFAFSSLSFYGLVRVFFC